VEAHDASDRQSVGERLARVLDHLGLAAAHVAGRSALDIADLFAVAPERVASAVLQGAAGRPEPLAPLGARALWLLGDGGTSAQMRPRLEGAPGQVRWIEGQAEYLWSDTVGERADEVAGAMLDFLGGADRQAGRPAVSLSGAGEVAGVTYTAAGAGTPILLLPLGLSLRQWEPILPRLRAGHCTITLGGRFLQPTETLEGRAESGYGRMALALLDLAAPRPGDDLVEVGCGTGALLRRIARHPSLGEVRGLDVNRFLLGEARALAARAGLGERLSFDEGSAEALPYADDSFDVVYSCTVMEEVDADRMMAELVRVARPGGRVAIGVRAIDRDQWTNLALPAELRRKVEQSSVGFGAAERGCADESLYKRMHRAGLRAVEGGPAWAWSQLDDPWWRGAVDQQTRATLSPAEDREWQLAVERARGEGEPVWMARAFHCAVGRKVVG
jgi:SAM-dependent methyltransferase